MRNSPGTKERFFVKKEENMKSLDARNELTFSPISILRTFPYCCGWENESKVKIVVGSNFASFHNFRQVSPLGRIGKIWDSLGSLGSV